MRTALIIPVCNAGIYLDRLLPSLACQTLKPDEWLVIDSQSSDDTVDRFRSAGARVVTIDATDFNHGGTRRWASEQVTADVLIYMTQDAILANPDSLRLLRDAVLSDDDIGVAYGRQLPHQDAGLFGSHSRQFNYPPIGRTKRLSDAPQLGIKTCFSSNSFCAYRYSALMAVGGFPEDVIGTEDAYVAGRMLLNNWAVRYEAGAQVYHSHDYTILEEFRRYFDIGVFYGRERWLANNFGKAAGEGRRYVMSEVQTLREAEQSWRLMEVVLRSGLKWAGFRLGYWERYLPVCAKRRISMFAGYWK